jgi:hypothetical protein
MIKIAFMGARSLIASRPLSASGKITTLISPSPQQHGERKVLLDQNKL